MITELAPVLEALLLASDKPLSVERLGQVFDEHDGVDNKRIKKTLRELQKSYDGRGYQLVEVASGFRFQVQQGYALWVARLWQEKPQKYSKALLETLSIIAYQQPITRGEIESIRGVGVSSSIIHTMIDRSWIRSVGHKEVPGRPELFATTKEFLDHFNLKQLSDLPALDELASWDEATMAPAKLKQPQQQEIDVVTESIH
ncbi:SMC-Scp complex subunit ScpB [Candidatus Njordibacter sp. Uisw_056]|jgi:segregation and condensation protein B|uniref:SMC-Scp complex subunit ScpB n=1 Tax=Candidatus Njordibacter sp. Uisw_056 TaxID=3230973 RepID=UPI003D4FDB73|tara:strand:+ start:1820 stop:2422 length:603 start_codon:yes stop_codon:yes gene_type:complete